MSQSNVAYRAAWVFPVSQPPIRKGVVVVDDREVCWVGREEDWSGEANDLGQAAIVPGLVNAHTHLEFSLLKRPLGVPGLSFPEWIQAVVASRRVDTEEGTGGRRAAIRQGLIESWNSGVVAVGEIASWPAQPDDYSFEDDYSFAAEGGDSNEKEALAGGAACGRDGRSGAVSVKSSASEVLVVPFFEILGESTSGNPRWEAAVSFLADWTGASAAGLSPHAPYSLRPGSFDRAMRWAEGERLAVAMHLAESVPEREWVTVGSGPFQEMLTAFGHPPDPPEARAGSFESFLTRLNRSRRALVIHGNDLRSAELDLMAGFRRLFVVYCPRTHQFFGHPSYPLSEMLARGIPVCLGTDSRASNPDLKLFAEMQTVRELYPGLPVQTILEMGTRTAARALGIADRFGTIEVGKSNRLAVVHSRSSDWDAAEGLLSSESEAMPLAGVGGDSLSSAG